jgi:hypothetical protein
MLGKKNKEEFNVYVIGLKPEFAKTKAAKSQNPNFVPDPVRRQSLLDTFSFELREYFDVSFCYPFYAS